MNGKGLMREADGCLFTNHKPQDYHFHLQIRNYAHNMIHKRKESASLVKRGHSASNVTIKTYIFPLPHHATWGNTQNHDHKLSVLSKVILEHIGISIVAWIDIQYILPWCLYPFCRHRDEPEDKCLDAACCFEWKRALVLPSLLPFGLPPPRKA